MIRGEGIYRLYITGGPSLLAYRLGHIFQQITTEEQKVMHNHVLDEVMDIINKTDRIEGGKLNFEERALLGFIADFILYKPVKRRKRFLFRLAERILDMGRVK